MAHEQEQKPVTFQEAAEDTQTGSNESPEMAMLKAIYNRIGYLEEGVHLQMRREAILQSVSFLAGLTIQFRRGCSPDVSARLEGRIEQFIRMAYDDTWWVIYAEMIAPPEHEQKGSHR